MKTSIFCLLATFLSLSSIAQTTITGTISNTFEEKLHNSHISIKGTDIGTVSENGSFSILATKKDTLVVSHLGYRVREIPVATTNLDITLDVDSLDEVFIQMPYSTRCGSTVYCITRGCGGNLIEVSPVASVEPKMLKTNQTALYPNPSANGFFNIKFPKQYKNVELKVITITGQVILQQTMPVNSLDIAIDLSPFATGMYLIQVEADGERLPTMRALKG